MILNKKGKNMKTPREFISEIKTNRKDEDPEKMDFLMRTIKAVHSSSASFDVVSPQSLEKHRASADSFSKLVAPSVAVDISAFNVDDIPCEWISSKFPHRKDKVILYCHGGGYISGGLGYARILSAKMAFNTSYDVISFEYRLAPEHPYPAAIEDAIKVWDYIMLKGYGAKDVIVAGDSAGSNLALELCLELKKTERLLPKALILMSPWTDMRLTNGSYKTYLEKDPLLTYEYVAMARKAYIGSDDEDFENPGFSPLCAELDNMPATLIQVGSNEILRDDSEKLLKKYNKYGSFAKLEVYPGGWHVFQQMPIAKAHQALENIQLFINEIL